MLLGDRYEIFAVSSAAAVLEIPIAHISGGDVTAGAQDEFFRHSITKMAKLHFPSCESSARRLIRMGEEPFRVCQVGGLGDENIRRMPRMGRAELEESIGFSPVSYTHLPISPEKEIPTKAMGAAFDLKEQAALTGQKLTAEVFSDYLAASDCDKMFID